MSLFNTETSLRDVSSNSKLWCLHRGSCLWLQPAGRGQGSQYLEQREAQIVFKQDTADAPHVTGMAPAQLWGMTASVSLLRCCSEESGRGCWSCFDLSISAFSLSPENRYVSHLKRPHADTSATVSSPHLVWPPARGNAVWIQWCCDARGQTWRCQSPPHVLLCS